MLEFTGIAIETPLQTWRWDDIQATPIKAVADPLVSLSYLPEKMVISPQYFIQQLPGAKADLFARETVQRKLNEAADQLPYGYKFVIFDAWRDMATQQALFDQMRAFVKRDHPDFDDQQVTQAALRIVALPSTNPAKPSPHNTGGSIDLSIVDEKGRLLPMGSPFDDISERARTDYYEKAPDSDDTITYRENRRLLYHVMTQAGFTNYIEEWWHFDYGNQNWATVSKRDFAVYGATKPAFPWI
ncbi:M15 family metallopeptidase [Weissella cibaria]|uniref:M15 family metallopeptidase n=1 Tax=Weissella cibaria TaxID=137591 RepID=UPI002A74EE8D|nr:M15 family metallopeptidase [Weissella cibaria]MDY2520150.1 M15 family metallopeptidase [Weissella cibaria]